jgi:hypothetical protein
MELTDYEKEKFSKLDTIPMNQWLRIDPKRSDYSLFMVCLDKYHSCWGNCLVIEREASRFKRVWATGTPENCKENNIKHWTQEL